jgi:hypothetical protein
MALMEKGVPPPQIFRAAMLCGMLPMQDRSDPEAPLRALKESIEASVRDSMREIERRMG